MCSQATYFHANVEECDVGEQGHYLVSVWARTALGKQSAALGKQSAV